MAANTMLESITLTVNCATPEDIGEKFVITACNTFNFSSVWLCTLTNQSPELEISLVWDFIERQVPSIQPQGINSFRIVSREGTILQSIPVNGIAKKTVMNAKVDMALVQVEQRLDFDIIVSTCPSTAVPSKSKIQPPPVSKSQLIMPSLLKDMPTMNMAFTFGFNGSARNVALWAHQSILSLQPKLSALMYKLHNIDNDPSSPEAVFAVKTTHVIEYSLEAYCALVRYLYTSEISLEVDLNDFAIGRPPKRPFSATCKERPALEEIFAPATLSSSTETPSYDMKRSTTWQELFSVADCYGVEELRLFCRDRVVESITDQNALKVFFEFAYKYEDTKAILLEYVFDSMDKLFASDEDPFEEYRDHPEKHALMIKVMQRKFKVMA